MADQPAPPAASSAPPLVGRERELATMRAALAAALAGRGSLVLIGGEAGIGKTALAEATLAEAGTQGALVLVGRCYDLSETPPYGPWQEALARASHDGDLLPRPDLTGGGAGSQTALFAQVRDYVAALAARRPLVVLLDDLHWADPASTDLLRALGRQLADLPLLLLATYRADELTRRHPLYHLLPTLVREARAARLDLRPLEAGAFRAFVRGYGLDAADAARLAAYLQGRAEGNPFFAGEVLRALAEAGVLRPSGGAGWALGDLAAVGVPPLLRQVIDARVDRLGEPARALLAAAAVVGQELPFAAWQAVAGAAEEALLDVAERAAEARLLAETPEGIRFAHALVREALHEGIPPLRRRAVHRRAGEALAALPHPDPDAVAYHFQRAGDPRAVDWLVRAGERAQRASPAWLTAAERSAAALALLEAAGGAAGQRAALLAALAQFRRYDDPRRGVADLAAAMQLAEEAGDRALALACRFDRGHLRCLIDECAPGLAEMLATLPALEALPAAERARLPALRILGVRPGDDHHRGALVIQLANAGRLAEARALAAPIAARGPGTTGRGLLGLGLVHAFLGQPELARRAYADARAAFRATGELVEVHRTCTYELTSVAWPYYADQPLLWAPLVAEADAVAARAGGAAPRLATWQTRSPLVVFRGVWPRREDRAAGQGEAITHRPDPLLARYRGDTPAAWSAIAAHLPQGPATAPGDLHFDLAQICQQTAVGLALETGDVPAARAWLAMQDRWLAWSGAVRGRAEAQLGWAAYHRAAGDPARARECAERALAHASAPRQPVALLVTHRFLGELATVAGQVAAAAAHLEAALALAEACAAPYERALTLLARAEWWAAQGQHAAALASLAEARAILAPLEARPALARADALTARLAAAPGPAVVYPAGLSAREAEVLRLVAQGLTNAQVAARLSLSPRTVDQHLRSIYNKLDVPSRAAATAYAIDHGLR